MDVSRRGVLGLLGSAAITKAYFFAPVGGWYSDVIVNPANIAPKLHIDKSIAVPYEGKYHTLWWLDSEGWRVEPRRFNRKLSFVNLPPLPSHLQESHILVVDGFKV